MNELATRAPGVQITSMDELNRVADMFARSGMFQDAKDAAQCGVKIMAGQAWGIDPFSAMTAVHLIQGRPTISAGVMAAKVKGHPKYDMRVRRLDNDACEIEFFQGAESIGVSTFTIDDAKAAGYASKSNWKQTPRNMLYARALSNGVRWFTPDVFSASVYTPEDFNEDGEAVDVQVQPSRPEKPAAGALSAPAQERTPEPAAAPEAPEAAREPVSAGITGPQAKALGAAVKKQDLDADTARSFFSWLFDRPIASVKELTKAEASRVIGWESGQWEQALADYAVALEGGPPEPDWSDVQAVEREAVPVFEPKRGKATA